MQYSGVARGGRGGICPRAPSEGGRQNHAKEFFKIYILRNFEKSETIQWKFSQHILDFGAPSHHHLTKLLTIFL